MSRRPTIGCAILTLGLVGCWDDDDRGEIPLDGLPPTGAAFAVVNLTSDVEGVGAVVNPSLVNPCGIAAEETSGAFFVAAHGASRAVVLDTDGAAVPIEGPLEVLVGSAVAPTSVVLNTTSSFVFAANGVSVPAELLLASEGGTISAFSTLVDPGTAFVVADLSAEGAVFTGLAIGDQFGADVLFAADFRNRRVVVLDSTFTPIQFIADRTLPDDFAPFNVAVIDDQLFVAFARQLLPGRVEDVAGVGNGFVEVFALDGTGRRRVVSNSLLNSPRAMVRAPSSFGAFGDLLLVANSGDGLVNAVDTDTGLIVDQLRLADGTLLAIDGLCGLTFSGVDSIGNDVLFFTAGPDGETHGLFGQITVVH